MNRTPWTDASIRKIVLRAFAATAILATGPAAFCEEAITAVRFWSQGDVTRIAIEATGQFEFHFDRLTNPERIFFDLPATHPKLSNKYVNVIPVGDRLVRQIRVAETQKGVTRIVLDLETAVVMSTSKLENPDRLMIELRTPGSTAPATAVEEPAPAPPPVRVVEQPAPLPPQPVRTFNPPPSRPVERVEPRKPVQPSIDPPAAETTSMPSSHSDPLSYVRTTVPGKRPSRTPAAPVVSEPAPPVVEPSVSASPDKVALPAKRSAREDSMIRALGLKVNRIVIDAGHGGHDVGSVGPEGSYEKDLTLDIAKRVGALIEQNMGSEVIYTRPDDTFIPLERRTAIANNSKGDLFLSIHANSSTIRTAAGVETYYLNFTTSKTALEVAARENASSEKSVFELQDLLHKIALKEKVDESREFATRIQNSLNGVTLKGVAHQQNRGVRRRLS